jgi:hypothetical protein
MMKLTTDEDEKEKDFREQEEVKKFVEEPNQRIYDSVENLVSPAGDEVKASFVFRLL